MTDVTDPISEITAWFQTVSDDVERLGRDAAQEIGTRLGSRSTVGPRDLRSLEALGTAFLRAHPFVTGAGAIFSPEVVADGTGVIEWWVAQGDAGPPSRLVLDLVPGGPRYYDYEKMPYFANALATRRQALWGPYVDYLGQDEYILTHTTPFPVNGRLAAVAGYDMRVRDLEAALMPALRAIPGDAALLNASDRVVMGNSGRYLVGERVRQERPGTKLTAIAVEGLGLRVICPEA